MNHAATDLLTRQEIQQFTRRSNVRGALSVTADWGLIGLALACAAAFPQPAMIVAAAAVIGGRQLGLAVRMHEAAHRALFRTPWLNENVGAWLCAAPHRQLPRIRRTLVEFGLLTQLNYADGYRKVLTVAAATR